jgi:predicted small lipoprotein YifL
MWHPHASQVGHVDPSKPSGAPRYTDAMRITLSLIVAGLLGAMLGCGQKGPLVLPDAQHPHKKIGIGKPPQHAPAPAQPAAPGAHPPAPGAQTPATQSPATTMPSTTGSAAPPSGVAASSTQP